MKKYYTMKTQSTRKGISSVVSVILLLSVMVSATFIIFNFYKSLESSYSSEIETSVNLEKYIEFEYIDSNKLFYSNAYKYDITFENLTFGIEECSISGSLISGKGNISFSSCSLTLSEKSIQVVLSYNNRLYSEYVLVKDNY
jgi:hypothetical protein